MLNVVLRALILFVLVYLVIRLMGKRQVGELQPVEFVVALMAADLATQPMGNLGMPLLWGVISLLVLLFMQVAVSYASMKSIRARRLLCGEPTVVISKGVINEQALRSQRYNVNDLLEQLRSKDVFDVSRVWYAMLETNGELSVLMKKEAASPTADDLGLDLKQQELPLLLVSDGKIMQKNLTRSGYDPVWLRRKLRGVGIRGESELVIAQLDGDTLYIQTHGGKKCCTLKVS